MRPHQPWPLPIGSSTKQALEAADATTNYKEGGIHVREFHRISDVKAMLQLPVSLEDIQGKRPSTMWSMFRRAVLTNIVSPSTVLQGALNHLPYALEDYVKRTIGSLPALTLGTCHLIRRDKYRKVGKSVLELARAEDVSSLTRTLERYVSASRKDDACLEMSVDIVICMSQGKASNLEKWIHRTMRLRHSELLCTDSAFGYEPRCGMCEVYKKDAKDCLLDLMKQGLAMTNNEMQDARARLTKERKRLNNQKHYDNSKKDEAVSGASAAVRKKPSSNRPCKRRPAAAVRKATAAVMDNF